MGGTAGGPRIQESKLFFYQNPGSKNNFLKNPNPMKIPQILQNPKSNEFSFKNPRSNDIFFQYPESKIKFIKNPNPTDF